MSNFLKKVNSMILELNFPDTELVFYQLKYESFGCERVIYMHFEKKFFIEFFYDGRDGVDYGIYLDRYYRYDSEIENLKFIRIEDLAKQANLLDSDINLTFSKEFEIFKKEYNKLISVIPKKS